MATKPPQVWATLFLLVSSLLLLTGVTRDASGAGEIRASGKEPGGTVGFWGVAVGTEGIGLGRGDGLRRGTGLRQRDYNVERGLGKTEAEGTWTGAEGTGLRQRGLD
ncbi:hypothetical protein NP493_370g06099 [Ridgeia piscesae]|uniref:Uncharacterized protein n=1 Tax=Ridgeia piscesae TaxID=27915 RepID=A0AAD9L3Q1_RIDPI|nr:hypothetical protein NP493_370g06099 [Ridgeia piscesae]